MGGILVAADSWGQLRALSPSCSQPPGYSAMDPRLNTGRWLTLTKTHFCISSRQGLSLCKICRALPGAITDLALSGGPQGRPLQRLVYARHGHELMG
jgi:hypothetical protein